MAFPIGVGDLWKMFEWSIMGAYWCKVYRTSMSGGLNSGYIGQMECNAMTAFYDIGYTASSSDTTATSGTPGLAGGDWVALSNFATDATCPACQTQGVWQVCGSGNTTCSTPTPTLTSFAVSSNLGPPVEFVLDCRPDERAGTGIAPRFDDFVNSNPIFPAQSDRDPGPTCRACVLSHKAAPSP